MIDDSLKTNILKSLELTGSATEDSIRVNKNTDNIFDRTSGKIRVRPSREKQFNLILSQPKTLAALSSFEIRCCVCNRVISYPAWHLVLTFTKNVFHYFICFDRNEVNKPTVNCKERE